MSEKIKLHPYGLSYNFNKFMYPGVTYQEIEQFFYQYDIKYELLEKSIIFGVNDANFLFFNKALDVFSKNKKLVKDHDNTTVEDIQLKNSTGIFKSQWVEYKMPNGKIIILTDCNERMDYKSNYQLLKVYD